MTHNSRCASAKSPHCKCSYGGSMHCGFSGGRMDTRRVRGKSRSYGKQQKHIGILLSFHYNCIIRDDENLSNSY